MLQTPVIKMLNWLLSEIFNRYQEFFTSSPVNAQQTKAFQALNRAWNLNCDNKLHDSKIILRSWLQNQTCNGRIYYRLGNQCTLEGIIHSSHYYMTQEERKFYSLVTSVSRKCCKFGNHLFPSKEIQSGTFKIIVDEVIPEDQTDPSDSQSAISLIKYFKRHAIPQGYSCVCGTCNYMNETRNNAHKCDQPALRITTLQHIPNLIIFEVFKPDAAPFKWNLHIDQEFEVIQQKYKLTGLIYHSQARAHYWSELYVDNSVHSINPARYSHDGLANGVMCVKTGDKTHLEQQGKHLSLVFFEKVNDRSFSETPSSTSKSTRTWSKTGMSPAGKTPVRKKQI